MIRCFYSSVIVSLLLSGCLIAEAKDMGTKSQKESNVLNSLASNDKKDSKYKKAVQKPQDSSILNKIASNYKNNIDFADAAKAALEKGFTLAKSKTDYMTAKHRNRQAILAFLPSVHVELLHSESDSDYKNSQGIHQKEKENQIQGVISQNLFHGFYNLNNARAMNNSAMAAKWKLANDKQAVVYQTLEAVCKLWYSKEKYKYGKMKEENLKKALIAEKDKLAAGISTKYDVAKAEADYAEAIYFADEAKFELAAAQAEFKKITTLEAPDDIALPDLDVNVPENINKLRRIAFSANPAILEATYARNAAEDYLRAVCGKLGPRVDVKASGGRYLRKYNEGASGYINKNEILRNRNAKSVVLSATIPIFENSDSGNTHSEIAIARESAKKSAFEVKDQQTNIERDCVTSYEQYKTSLTLIKSATQAVHSAEIGVEGDHQESDLGLKSLTETLVREKQLCDLRISLAEAMYRLALAKGKMMQAMGKLSLENLSKAKGASTNKKSATSSAVSKVDTKIPTAKRNATSKNVFSRKAKRR